MNCCSFNNSHQDLLTNMKGHGGPHHRPPQQNPGGYHQDSIRCKHNPSNLYVSNHRAQPHSGHVNSPQQPRSGQTSRRYPSPPEFCRLEGRPGQHEFLHRQATVTGDGRCHGGYATSPEVILFVRLYLQEV